jgi:hypothetical protein
MEIENLSMNMSQDRVQQDAALKTESMALQNARDQSEALNKMMEAAAVITDPKLGNYVDIQG